MTRKIQLFILLSAAVATTLLITATNQVAAVTQNTVSFNRDIRPILSDTCFLCHGPDKNSRKAGLRLDIREEATKKTKSGITPIVPGKPEESEIVRRVFATDKYEVMPPPDAHKDLTAQQKELLKRWVAEGAAYEGHWAYQLINRPAIPTIQNPKSKIQNPIDAFIQARLAKAGLQPSPEADRRTLIRRVTLDLTGLPPTSQEVAAFVIDKAPDAYEKLVDRLLASPRYAEKQAMHWLDAVRYADTAGFHGDNPYPTWPYRDYVLRAFRNNKPFDEFTREQIAGDLLPNATQEQRVASAYNRLNRVSAEGGVQPKEYIAKYGADRVRTTSNVWLGATMGCAECHDHKFDPILAKDFYAMKAFFADIKETGLVPDRGAGAWGSKMMLATLEQNRRLHELNELISRAQTELEEKAMAMNEQRVAWEKRTLDAYNAGKLAWKFQMPLTAKTTNGATLTIYKNELVEYNYGDDRLYLGVVKMPGNGLVIASGANPDNETYTITIKPGAGEWMALGLQVVKDRDLPGDNVARGGEKFVLTEVEAVHASGATAQRLEFNLVTPDAAQDPAHPAMSVLDGNPKTGWSTTYGMGRTPFIALRLAHKLKTDAQSILTIKLRHDSEVRRATIGRFRLALSDAEFSWPESDNPGLKPLQPTPPMRPIGHNGLPDDVGAALQVKAKERTEAQQKLILEHFKWAAPELQSQLIRLAHLRIERDLLDAGIPRVLATETKPPDETRILPRGNWMDESGEIVQPSVPVFLGKLLTGERRATRLDLANWLVSKDNPLTARVFVNRAWRQFFGTGLSKVLDDFGSQGEWPVHPELLDWLAATFRDGALETMKAERGTMKTKPSEDRTIPRWDMKAIHRLIVTSATYRQSSSIHPSSLSVHPSESDPDNRLLAHQNRFRVDAEVVRDIALSVSGLLVEKFGGPSVKPLQPENYLAALNFPKRDYAASRGEDLYRRGVYTHWQRTFLHPSLLTFDAPTREECAVNRVNSNTPLQALVLLNDPIYVEAARVFAQNALQQSGPIRWAFEQAIGRQPSATELRVLTALHKNSLLQFQRDPKAAKELVNVGESLLPKNVKLAQLAAMMTVTRAILNLHETITRN